MAALDTGGAVLIRDAINQAFEVQDAETVYPAGLQAIDAATGRLKAFTGVAGDILIGRGLSLPNVAATDGVLGDITPPAGTETPQSGVLLEPEILMEIDVDGVADVGDVMSLVYSATDNIEADATLTRPAAPNGRPVGLVIKHHDGAICDVYRFGFSSLIDQGLAGAGVDTIDLFVSPVSAGFPGNALTGYVMPYGGTILSVDANIVQQLVGGGGDVDLNLELDGVDVTGGVIEALTADGIGDRKAGTAVTAANTFAAGALLDVEGIENTAVTDGLVLLQIVVQKSLAL